MGFVRELFGLVSDFQMEINGQRGWAYHHPGWHDVPGDKYWVDEADIQLPTSALKQGANTLVLPAVNEPREVSAFGGLTYDALEMHQDPSHTYDPAKISIQVEPTIFYQREGDQLLELVDVYIRHNSPAADGRFDLTLGGQKFSAQLTSPRSFGEEHLQLAVPEFAPETKAEASVTVGNNSQQLPVTFSPARKWTLFIVPNEHLDIGYTDYQARVAEVQTRALDEVMDLIPNHPGFVYSPDGYWVIQQFLAGRNAQDQQRLRQMVRDRKIFVPAQYACLLTEFPGIETLIRSLYPSYQYIRSNGADFNYANITDIPSQSWSYPSVLAAAGLKYFVSGSNPDRGPIMMNSHILEQSPFWWEGPDGEKVLTWYAFGYGNVAYFMGNPPQVKRGSEVLPLYLQTYPPSEYKASAIMLFGAQGENTDMAPQQASIAEEWNKVYAYPKLTYTGIAEAIRQIADQLGDSIPVIKGDGGPYWEDGIYSDAQHAIQARRTEQRAPSAEKISTIATLVHPYAQADRGALQRLWQNILIFDEHTWTSSQSVSCPDCEQTVRQLATKDDSATQADQDLDYLLERGMAEITADINGPRGAMAVFNPLNWQRSGLVEADVRRGSQLVDLVTRKEIPYQVMLDMPARPPYNDELHSFQHIRFVAQDIPSLGYRCYTTRPPVGGRQSVPLPQKLAGGTTLESAHYRIVLDVESGAVKSIFDRDLKKELVNAASPYRFDQYLYVTGGDKPIRNPMVFGDRKLPPPEVIAVHPTHGGRLVSVERAPFGTVAHLESSATYTPRIQTDIILFDSQKKIEFINHVEKQKVYTKEGVYFAFPFAADNPQVRYDLQNGFVDPTHDILQGGSKDWMSAQHWVAVQQGDTTAVLVPADAELFTLGDVVRGKWSLELNQHRGTVFSYVMNNYWHTNWPAGQGGDFTFRYILTSGKDLQPGQLSRFGWEEMTPLESGRITHPRTESAPAQELDKAQGSFLQVNQSNVVLVNWKTAEDGQGTVLRFLEVAGQAGTVEVQIPILQVQAAWMCNAMEENQQPLTTATHEVTFSVKPFQIVTVRVQGIPVVP